MTRSSSVSALTNEARTSVSVSARIRPVYEPRQPHAPAPSADALVVLGRQADDRDAGRRWQILVQALISVVFERQFKSSTLLLNCGGICNRYRHGSIFSMRGAGPEPAPHIPEEERNVEAS